MRLDGQPDPVRVRAAYCTDDHIRATAAAYAYRSRLNVVVPGQRGAVVNLTKPGEATA